MDYCRACMISQNMTEMCFLYKNNLDTIYSKCTSLELYESDNLPSYICHNCNKNLLNFNKFRNTCLESEETFKHKIKIEKTAVTFDEKDNINNFVQPLLVAEFEVQHFNRTENRLDIIDTKLESEEKPDSDEISVKSIYDSCDVSTVDEDDELADSKPKKKEKKLKKLICDMCEKTFLAKHILAGHLRQHIGLKPFACDICDKSYNRYLSLVSHQRLEHPTDENTKILQYNCDYKDCERAFQFKYALNVHINAEHKSADTKIRTIHKQFVCEICNKFTHRKYQMEAHMRAAHEGKRKGYECNKCGREYLTYRSLSQHTQRAHAHFEKHKCDFEGCEKEYSFESTLVAHRKIVHLGIPKPGEDERRHVCDQCGKAFKHPFGLRSHTLTHTGERPFGCEICPKRFALKTNLKEHVKRHLNIRKFICPICGQTKTTSSELKVHINKHTKEKTFQCTMCPSVFTSRSSHCRHVRIVHLNKPPYYDRKKKTKNR